MIIRWLQKLLLPKSVLSDLEYWKGRKVKVTRRGLGFYEEVNND